ncbi:MAG: DUF748 domain-containing protein [Planctomycetota bacterium]
MSDIPSNDPMPEDAVADSMDAGGASSAPTVDKRAAKKAKKAAKKRGRGSWLWRWTKRLAITAVVARLGLWLFLEHLANFGAGFAGLSVSWRSHSLSIAGLSLHIEDLLVRDAEDETAPPLLTAQDVLVDASMKQLLTGQVHLVDANVAGARVTMHRNADGTLRLPKAWLEPAPPEEPEPEEEVADDEAPLSFVLPAWVESVRVHDLQFDYVDASTTPATEYSGKLDLDVADVGFPDRTGMAHLRLHAPQLCDELFVKLQIEAEDKRAEARLEGAVRGFRPHRFDEVPPEVHEILNHAHVVDLRLGGNITAEVLPNAPRLPAFGGKLDLGLGLDGIERTTLVTTFGPTVCSGGSASPATGAADAAGSSNLLTPLALDLHIDRIVERLELVDGTFEQRADGSSAVSAKLSIAGLTGDRIQPQLDAAGVELPDGGLSLDAGLQANLGETMSFELKDLVIAGGGEPLELPRVAIEDLRSGDDGDMTIGAVHIEGPSLPIVSQADGSMLLAGLRLKPAAPAPAAPKQPAADPAADVAAAGSPDAAPTLPKIFLRELRWSGVNLAWTDETRTPAATLAVRDLDVQADAITIGQAGDPGTLRATFSVADTAERVALALTVTPRDDGLNTDLELDASGVTLKALTPWLEPMGISSELTSGTFHLGAGAQITTSAEALVCDVTLGDLRFVDGDTRWLALRSVRGEGVRIEGDSFDAGDWTVQDPFAKLHRDEQLALHALGLRIGEAPAPAAGSGADPAIAATRLSAAEQLAAAEQKQTTPKPRRLMPNTNEPLLNHGPIRLEGLAVSWSDASMPDRQFQIGLDAELGANRGGGEALPVRATVRLDRAVRSFTLDAALKLTPALTTLRGALQVRGLVGDELAPLLPPGMACTLVDGRIDADLDARIGLGEDHTELTASMTSFRLRDGEQELFAVDKLIAKLPTLAADEVHLEDLQLTGVRGGITQTADAMLVPGFAIAATPPAAPSAPETPEAPAAQAPAPAAAETEPSPIVAEALTLPRLRLDSLRLGIERFIVRDRSSDSEPEPIVLQAELTLPEPWLGDPTDEEPTPLHLVLAGSVEPFGGQLGADVRVNLFDLQPTFDLVFSLADLDTTKLKDVMPALADSVQGEAEALTLEATLHARLDMKRRDASKLPLGRPFGAEFLVENLALRDARSARSYASIAAIDVIARSIDPRSGTVLLRSIDIEEPKAIAWNDADGTHVAGFLLPPAPAPAEEPAETSDAPTPSDLPANPPKAQPNAPASGSQGEFTVDRLRVMGLQVTYDDATTAPPTHLQLVDTDLQVQRFSTRAMTEARPISFALAVRGGDVELEERIISSSVLSGFIASGAEALVGGGGEHKMEQRPLLDQLLIEGRMQLYPSTLGRVKVALDRLELPAFRGMAKQAGVDLADGLLDLRVRTDLRGYEGIDVESESVFTWLTMTEPPNGPLATYLRLPAPLQAVLFLLRNSDDEQRLPLDLHLPANGVSTGAVASVAVETLVRLISDAVASAGTRAAGALLGASTEVPKVTALTPFQPGANLPDDVDLQPLLDAVRGDPTLAIVLTHELGTADLPHAEALANPAREVIERTIASLQKKRRELEQQREPLANELVALYAAQRQIEALQRQRELNALDQQLGELLTALGEALDQLGDDNPRTAKRRTRRAAQELAEARVEAVAARLEQLLPELGNGRLDLRPGRGVPIAGVDDGGRVTAVIRRRSTQTIADDAPNRARRQADKKPGDQRTSIGSGPEGASPAAQHAPGSRVGETRR